MAKRPVSLTLDEKNLLWLKGMSKRSGARSLSETVDRLITSARESGVAAADTSRSVVGTIDIAAQDAALESADEALHEVFARSLARPVLVKEPRAPFTASRSRRRRG